MADPAADRSCNRSRDNRYTSRMHAHALTGVFGAAAGVALGVFAAGRICVMAGCAKLSAMARAAMLEVDVIDIVVPQRQNIVSLVFATSVASSFRHQGSAVAHGR